MQQRKHEAMMIEYAKNPHLEAQCKTSDGQWVTASAPIWTETTEYRLVDTRRDIQGEIDKVHAEYTEVIQELLDNHERLEEERIEDLDSILGEVLAKFEKECENADKALHIICSTLQKATQLKVDNLKALL